MENTAKNFALQLGSLIALYISLSALVALVFSIINLIFPDAAAGTYQHAGAQGTIRFSIAMLIVFFPTYIVLTCLVNQIRRKSEGKYLAVTRWLIYLSLLVGGGILLGDLVAVIHTYLDGELSTRFICKALSLLIIIGAAFQYYVLDARGYWHTHEDQSKRFGAFAISLVVATVVLGFFNTDSPSVVRERRLDDQEIIDLQNIQWHIESYYRTNGALPATLESVYPKGVLPPEAPTGRAPYRYTLKTKTSFELCADFAEKSDATEVRPYIAPAPAGIIKNPDNWDHSQGAVCFERVIGQ